MPNAPCGSNCAGPPVSTRVPDMNPNEPNAEDSAGYTLEILARITGVSTRTILQYQEHGLIHQVSNGEPRFDDEAVRALRRIEHLRDACEMNLAGLKLLASLLEEVEKLRHELHTRR